MPINVHKTSYAIMTDHKNDHALIENNQNTRINQVLVQDKNCRLDFDNRGFVDDNGKPQVTSKVPPRSQQDEEMSDNTVVDMTEVVIHETALVHYCEDTGKTNSPEKLISPALSTTSVPSQYLPPSLSNSPPSDIPKIPPLITTNRPPTSLTNLPQRTSSQSITESESSPITNGGILKHTKVKQELTPEMKLKMQQLLQSNAGVLKQDSSTLMLGVYNMAPKSKLTNKEMDKRFSTIAMEMLREREDRDVHPYGRGGRFEGVLYSRRVKVQLDHSKFLAWIIFAGFILLTSGAIIFLAEMERRQKSAAQSVTQPPLP